MIIINPGAEPLAHGHFNHARRNMSAFTRELFPDLKAPKINLKYLTKQDGRYKFKLIRGIRKTHVEMPGLPLNQVQYQRGLNPWNFPRLYVNGSSWLWEFAVGQARDDLMDYDGRAEAGYKQSEADVDFVVANEPRCSVCGSIKDTYHEDGRKVNKPYGYERVRCLTCVPVIKTSVVDFTGDIVYVDDSWKRAPGFAFCVTKRLMPKEALGGNEDPLCTKGYYSNKWCRLKHGHDGACKEYWDVVGRAKIE